jgi:hypothetical protein
MYVVFLDWLCRYMFLAYPSYSYIYIERMGYYIAILTDI